MRSAVRPSHKGGMRLVVAGPIKRRRAWEVIFSGSVPTMVLVPISTVTGRSVFSRKVRMTRKDKRHVRNDLFQCLKYSTKRFRIVHIRWAMQRQHCIGFLSQPQSFLDSRLPGPLEILVQRIDHYIPHEPDPLCRYTLGSQVVISIS